MTAADPARMHRYDQSTAELARAVFDYVSDRTQREVPLDGPRSAVELEAEVGGSVTAEGLGWEEALRRFTDVLAPATISMDHPLHLAYVPAAPTEAAVLFDLVVSASSIFGGSWQEGAGAVFAENQALAWLAGLCDLPDGAGGWPRLVGLEGRAPVPLARADGGAVNTIDVSVALRPFPLARYRLHQRRDRSVVLSVDPDTPGAADEELLDALAPVFGAVPTEVDRRDLEGGGVTYTSDLAGPDDGATAP